MYPVFEAPRASLLADHVPTRISSHHPHSESFPFPFTPSNISTVVTTSPPESSSYIPGVSAQDGAVENWPNPPTSPISPALSDASTADGEDEEDFEGSPGLHALPAPPLPPRTQDLLNGEDELEGAPELPPLPAPPLPPRTQDLLNGEVDELEGAPDLPPLSAPPLPPRTQNLLRSPTADPEDETQFGTASWGSPYPRTDRNLRRQSFSSEASDDSPIHHLEIDTPFLRPAPELSEEDSNHPTAISAAAAVLANRVRRQVRGLTEDWIRTHTTGDLENVEPKHWLSDGSGSEHSSLSGSDIGAPEADLRTPKASKAQRLAQQSRSRHPRGKSSISVGDSITPRAPIKLAKMATTDVEPGSPNALSLTTTKSNDDVAPTPDTPTNAALISPVLNGDAKLPATPTKVVQKLLPKEPKSTPRIKKKVPWKGKNIMVLLPRDEERGLPGKPPMPLRQDEIEKMFASWTELGYGVDGFDLVVDEYQPAGSNDSQSRGAWPDQDDLNDERSHRNYHVALPDLNAWGDYVNELQEAKLRALGVSDALDEPPAEPSPPPTSVPSRQASVQYPPLPFSPPIPTSSAASNPYPFGGQFGSVSHSPNLAAGTSPGPFQTKFNPRQSISFSGNNSPFQLPQSPGAWPGLPGLNRSDSPSFANLNGAIPSQPPFDVEGLPPAISPALNMHQRQQSLQYPLMARQTSFQFPPPARDSSRLQEVYEDEEEEMKSPSKTPEPQQNNFQPGNETGDGEYHLEEQLRNELEHEDYNPLAHPQEAHEPQPFGQPGSASGGFQVPAHFANQPEKPITLHHPRPHSRGHSLSQNFLHDHNQIEDSTDSGMQASGSLHDIIESRKGEDSWDIETNPDDLGPPIQNFDFSAPFGQHTRDESATSNPWNDSSSVSNRRASHASKPSLSKLNVQAPEFKFNPSSSFTPGQFSFGGETFQPSIFQANTGDDVADSSFDSLASLNDVAKVVEETPSFVPQQTDFSFSSSGPKFRPDAPAFMPFQPFVPQAGAHGSGTKHAPQESIFGNIEINTEIVKPVKTSKAIPIVPPSMSSPANDDDDLESLGDGAGRYLPDDTRTKRAKSAMPDGDDVALFAEQPKEMTRSLTEEAEESLKDEPKVPVEEDQTLPADTSMSSAITSDHIDTMATTAAPSETSPAEAPANGWTPFEFDNKFDATSFNEARPSGEDIFQAGHRKSLSATAPSFLPRVMSFGQEQDSSKQETPRPDTPEEEEVEITVAKRESRASSPNKRKASGLGASRFASPPPKPKGLAASRFASAASVAPSTASESEKPMVKPAQKSEPVTVAVASVEVPEPANLDTEKPADHEQLSFEDIDAVMEQFGNDPSLGVNKVVESQTYQEAAEPVSFADTVPSTSTFKFEPRVDSFVFEEGKQAEPLTYPTIQHETNLLPSTELDDPFVDPQPQPLAQPEGENDAEDTPASDWEAAFSADEHDKLENRAQFFDGRVNEVVGTLLASRLEPLENALFSIQDALALKAGRPSSSRRDLRSVSAEQQHSDADDEDEEPVIRRSLSPRRDRRLDQIRTAVMEAMTAQQRMQPLQPVIEKPHEDESQLADLVSELKKQLEVGQKPEFDSENLKAIVEQAVKSQLPVPAPASEVLTSDEPNPRALELEAKVAELEQRLQESKSDVEKEILARRAAEDNASELDRRLKTAETHIEVEVINRSVYDQRVADLEEKLRYQEAQAEEQVQSRRAAEDRLSEVQRLLRIASEEEDRLRETVEEKDQRIKTIEQTHAKSSMKMALLEASSTNSTQSKSELANKLNILEADLRNVRLDNDHWRTEAERNDELAHRRAGELAHIQEEYKHLQKTMATLTTQLEENERLRESWRGKFMSLQDDMRKAAREIAEENARHIKKDQVMQARQEVLDARLQAEAKTRERLEVEMERLQNNERAGIRAATECTRLEGLLGELKTENHKLQQRATEAKLEFEEARESGLSEVKRTRMAMQSEIDDANHHVNVVREELEEENSKLRAELDNFKLEADTVKARNEMLLEEADSTKASEMEELKHRHQNELEDLQDRHDRQRQAVSEESSKTEQNLLERLSFSSTKIDHLQDRINHLEEKLEVSEEKLQLSKEAAAAAVAAAKSAGAEPKAPSAAGYQRPDRRSQEPEKISPQALRESIMVLQEQLQAREQRIEELEQTVAKLDPEAEHKIAKRDDEISWLRELLAVRRGDLQDIVTALSGNGFDQERVKDAAIRLKANLQMEEQERERAMNGGSSLSLPSIAQSISASPRVAQTIGPLAAAWGNWRKGSTSSFSGFSARPQSGGRNNTPSRGPQPSRNSQLGGLMTPPASSVRQMPALDTRPQPTAFASTGRRYPSHGNAPGPSGRARNASLTSRQEPEPMPIENDISPGPMEEEQPMTPPMMRSAHYDSDAQPGDFDDDDFFEET